MRTFIDKNKVYNFILTAVKSDSHPTDAAVTIVLTLYNLYFKLKYLLWHLEITPLEIYKMYLKLFHNDVLQLPVYFIMFNLSCYKCSFLKPSLFNTNMNSTILWIATKSTDQEKRLQGWLKVKYERGQSSKLLIRKIWK